MPSWELVCLIGFTAFLGLGILGIFAIINSGLISREQEPHERAAYIEHLAEELGDE